MSWEATAYVKDLKACHDNAPLSRGQKLLLFVLADYHNTKYRVAWPSVPHLAEEALTSVAQVKRDLAYLEEHAVIRKLRPTKTGRGWICAYQFLALDAKDQLELARSRPNKTAQDDPLFCPEKSSSEGAHSGKENSSEGAQKGFTERNAIRKNEEPEQIKPNQEHHACGALKLWLDTKARLEKILPSAEYKLWVESAKLTWPMSGTQLLIGLPPNKRIVEAAKARKSEVRQLLAPHGFDISFTSYPDAHQMERIRNEYPDVYAQFSPAMRRAHEQKCEVPYESLQKNRL